MRESNAGDVAVAEYANVDNHTSYRTHASGNKTFGTTRHTRTDSTSIYNLDMNGMAGLLSS